MNWYEGLSRTGMEQLRLALDPYGLYLSQELNLLVPREP